MIRFEALVICRVLLAVALKRIAAALSRISYRLDNVGIAVEDFADDLEHS